jgi:hypothetical protein
MTEFAAAKLQVSALVKSMARKRSFKQRSDRSQSENLLRSIPVLLCNSVLFTFMDDKLHLKDLDQYMFK